MLPPPAFVIIIAPKIYSCQPCLKFTSILPKNRDAENLSKSVILVIKGLIYN